MKNISKKKSRNRPSVKAKIEAPLDKIDFEDKGYAVSFDPDPADLLDSVAVFGVINPVRLLEAGDRCVPISGWRRLYAAKELNFETIPALIYSGGGGGGEGLNDIDAMRLSLMDNFPLREYTVVEASEIVSRLIVDFGVGEDEVVEDFFGILKLSPSKKVLKDLLLVGGLSGEIKTLSHKRRYTLKPLIRWCGFDDDDRESLYRLVVNTPMSSGVIAELCGFLSDIVKRDGLKISEVLVDPELKMESILTDESISSNERGEKIRGKIRVLRYPILQGLLEKFKDNLTGLNLPRGATISHHPYFEADSLTLSFRFKDCSDLEKLERFLSGASQSEEMKKLLEIV
jgi:hypothetical protein